MRRRGAISAPARPRPMCRLAALTVALGMAALGPAPPAGTPDDEPVRTGPFRVWVRAIAFEGLTRHAPEQVTAASGLQVGDPVEVRQIETAARRLLDTGLFRSVKDKYFIISDQVDVTFIVEEGEAVLPVVFDNFLWFDDDQLRAAVARELPVFDGTAPETGSVLDSIGAALQHLLQAWGRPGTVERYLDLEANDGKGAHVFAVAGSHMPICAVRFSGVPGAEETQLQELAGPLLGQEYSGRHVNEFVKLTLIPFYHHRGFLNARFGEPHPVLDERLPCAGDVAVVFAVTAGPAYTVRAFEWSQPPPLPPGTLEQLVKVRPGDPADPEKVQEGMTAVKDELVKRAYLMAEARATPAIDDDARLVSWKAVVRIGPRYRMGGLTIEGAPGAVAARLKSSWKLAAGEPYDPEYPRKFIQESASIAGALGPGRHALSARIARDDARQAVDVTLTIR